MSARRLRAAEPARDRIKRERYRFDGNWIKALERAGRKCEMCGSESNLHVHHRDGSGETDSPNHSLDNLVVACGKCHSAIHEINYRIIDGKLYVLGKIFEIMGVNTVEVLPLS
jgi:hypothetical protein